MTDVISLRQQFEGWADYVRSLDSLPESDQLKAVAEGKWAVRDVIAHMWKWDIFFWEHAVRPLIEGTPLTYHSLDFNAFNENAKNECRPLFWSYLIEQTANTRDQIANAVRQFPESEYERTERDADGNPFSMKAYLEDFIHHDAHHRLQIESVLSGK
ncbi:DinB family protein [Cohnella pontilimi]|uniref:DinB family protein n=1 Tax=Cohnella pontilimi TaxID=2564100 RepID=A0A4U0FGW0_9BACL|nr:DinB family protein [Cohnella pontilimi]TJY44171.1 DinB family protein [Cohnella pontilimi]